MRVDPCQVETHHQNKLVSADEGVLFRAPCGIGSDIRNKGLVLVSVAPVADPTNFGVVMLDNVLGLEEIFYCPYNVASPTDLWLLREDFSVSGGGDGGKQKRGGSGRHTGFLFC